MTIGLTGGIGSGKTEVSNRFAARGICVVDADAVARVVVEPGRPALDGIVAHWGTDLLHADGTLDRTALRARVFADASERRWLEQLMHPRIGEEMMAQIGAATSAYVLLVAPLLLERGRPDYCRRILVVDVPEDMQIQRTMVRDDNSAEQVQRIIAAQMSRAQRLELADDVICNDGDLASLERVVEARHQQYLQLAAVDG